jgi:hypothetical protein
VAVSSPDFHKFPVPNFVKIRQTIWHFTGRQEQGIGLQVKRSSVILRAPSRICFVILKKDCTEAFQVSAAKYVRTALYWANKQRAVVNSLPTFRDNL